MKSCSRCQTLKPLSQFRTDGRLASGLAAKCKDCSQKECRAWRKAKAALRPEKKRCVAPRDKRRHDKEYWNKWAKENPEILRSINAKKRAKRAGVSGAHTGKQLRQLLWKQKFKCASCLCSIKTRYHADHIIPIKLGGDDYIANIQLLCPPCNLAKGAKDPFAWAAQSGRLL